MVIFEATGREYKGNLHMHTTMSDGQLDPMQAVMAYESRGYDFLAVTDHRMITRIPEYRGRLLLLTGIELDEEPTEREVLHFLGIGVHEGLTEGIRPGMKAREYIDAILRNGGVPFLAHPHWSMNRPDTIKGLEGLAGVEIYNSVSRPPYNADRADSTHILDLLASDGLLHPTIAADDSHFYGEELARSFTLLQADRLEREDVVGALRRGRFYASQGPRFERVELDGDIVRVICSPVSAVVFHSDLAWNDDRATAGSGVTQAEYRLDRGRGESFIRIVLIGGDGKRAWLNPFRV